MNKRGSILIVAVWVVAVKAIILWAWQVGRELVLGAELITLILVMVRRDNKVVGLVAEGLMVAVLVVVELAVEVVDLPVVAAAEAIRGNKFR